MTKQELETQNGQLLEALSRANTANRELSELVQKLTQKLNDAIERVKYLDGQVKMLELQKQAATKYSDSDRNY